MANSLATLGQFRIGTTEYAAGQARADGSWHMVRKQYGDNSSAYTYARFTTEADYLAARANPAAATWLTVPYSSVNYDILLLPLATPLPTSTAGSGAATSTDPPATEMTLAALLALAAGDVSVTAHYA